MDGPVIGVRRWSSRLAHGIHLTGIGPHKHLPIAVWRPGANQAVCATPATHETEVGSREPVPASGCGCGLYAWHEYTDGIGRFADEPTALKSPVGIVRGWGRMQLHPDGWRSEFAEILALVENGDSRMRNIAERYQVPLLPARSMPEIAIEFGDVVPHWMRPAVINPQHNTTRGDK